MGVMSEIKSFGRGLGVIFGSPPAGQGDRKLAQMAGVVEAQIVVYGKDRVRTQLIKSIEADLKRAARKGGKPAVDAIVDNAVATPEYMRLLHKLGMEEPELRVLAMDTLRGRRGQQ